MEKKRLEELLEIGRSCKLESPKFDENRFYWVFGNLIQEYFADLIYENVKTESDFEKVLSRGLEVARNWFGEEPTINWPFHQGWLKNYLYGRYFGERSGMAPEDKRNSGVKEFIKNNPRSESKCNWYLGCELKENLEVDHICPWRLHGPSYPEQFQWLCKKHNNNWKKTLIIWGDNFIPFKHFSNKNRQE